MFVQEKTEAPLEVGEERWKAFLRGLKPTVAAILLDAKPRLEGDALVLAFPPGKEFHQKRALEKKAEYEAKVKRAFGVKRVELVLDPSAKKPKRAGQPSLFSMPPLPSEPPEEHFGGPALVLAGPGAGKTRAVVERTIRLLKRGVDPKEITLLTFTRKAAGEMRERLEKAVGANEVLATTFHGLSARIVQSAEGHLRVLDDPEELIGLLLKEVEAPGRIKPKAVMGAISRVKNSLLPGLWKEEEILGRLKVFYPDLEPWLTQVYLRYEEEKRKLDLLDYDDLLWRALSLLERDGVRRHWRKRARFLIVDEYQDTNPIQFALLIALLSEEKNIMVVGDPNQAIYSWRGAEPKLILEFTKHFRVASPSGEHRPAKVYTLTTNYRSHSGIVRASVEVLKKSPTATVLPLKALREGPLPFKVYAQDEEEEAAFIGKTVLKALEEGIRAEEIAVLFRSLAYTREVEGAFRRLGIPYTVVGGMPFWKRREVRLVLDFLRAPKDPMALARLSALFLRGVGEKRANSLVLEGGLEKVEGSAELLSHVQAFERLYGLEGGALFQSAAGLLAGKAFREYIWPILLAWAEGEPEGAGERWETALEVLKLLRDWTEENPTGGLELFLAEVASPAQGEVVGEGGVQLMTVHASKGLEFHTVFVTGLREGKFPAKRAMESLSSLEEERRLFYVALTRAKERVYLTCPEGVRGVPSRFFDECPGEGPFYSQGGEVRACEGPSRLLN